MNNSFRWNPYADQPHNVAPKSERLKTHIRYADAYFIQLIDNLVYLFPGLRRFRALRKKMYVESVEIGDSFGLCFTPHPDLNPSILECFQELGIQKALFRIPSWERKSLDLFERTCDLFNDAGIELTVALLQQRADVKSSQKWDSFVRDVLQRLGKRCAGIEIGHAWNRTKWGIWDFREYIRLAESAGRLAAEHGMYTLGPAVIDFEFHLYPSVLRRVHFDVISSLLYADRVGSPENKQYGWDLAKKIALLRAAVDVSGGQAKELWVTEFNWPLKGTGKYSPASGKPNVTEKEQADFLSRYFLLGLSSGCLQRIYWWQLIAPGYGLIDDRNSSLRKRPAFFALKTLVQQLRGARFTGRIPHPSAFLFTFVNNGRSFAAGWTNGSSIRHTFARGIDTVLSRNGQSNPVQGQTLLLNSSPQWIFFK
ncbi:MAG: hypothetical protein KKD59_06645 [Acidobacteria bacterium]|nr:hypothetical protein [Acidobacteriota bacterium]MBU4496038.1 hypothetical protein [Acidobacteriota bacterium]